MPSPSSLRNASLLLGITLFTSSAVALPAGFKPLVSRDYGLVQSIKYGDQSGHVNSAWFSSDFKSGKSIPSDPDSSYNCYDGAVLSEWPDSSEWLSFEEMWENNLDQLQHSNTDEENGYLHDAITTVSTESSLDARLIFAIIMQESTGKIHVPCNGEDANNDGRKDHCGLMQAPAGSVGFDEKDPKGSIEQMVRDGVYGVDEGRAKKEGGWPGLLQYFSGVDLGWVDAKWYGNPYVAARMYNSGLVDTSGDINYSPFDPTTMAYANDVANRLTGWSGKYAGCKISETCPRSKSTDDSPLRDPKLGQCV